MVGFHLTVADRQKFLFHNLKSEEAERRLPEQQKVCSDDLATHFEETLLLKLPENYQSVLNQSLISEVDDMVPLPLLNTFVVCRSNNFVSLSSLYELEGEIPETVEMERGDLYKIVKGAFESGQIDLI
ncbi:PREDICTED: uncharacterized protein LOC104751561 [Camelina sativa]|uniref:Uncharacterized protein LOC104751561 n=1 Tax=Camelina sativa TaxID=90675 RepID=A0ABM0WJ62_CAMSA|nr:PREDICTED: uncharacterized protein LOC104751561 [Camelina sativa]